MMVSVGNCPRNAAVGSNSDEGNFVRRRSDIAPGIIVYEIPLTNLNSQTASTIEGFFSFSVAMKVSGTIHPSGADLPFHFNHHCRRDRVVLPHWFQTFLTKH